MLELSNKEVAIEWLKMVPESSFDAAVYFDSNDILQSIDRDDIVTEFDCSVYRDNLSRCIVYLDDAHTRGTDLKFPLNWTACVTLSGDITRDKTVQSCMRMRRLGENQKICFLASYEADLRLREVCHCDNVTTENVIKFICQNSCQYEVSNMVHWVANALNYAKKSIGHKIFENSTDETAMKQLYDICVDTEFIKLDQTYGCDKRYEKLTAIAATKISQEFNKYAANYDFESFFYKMRSSVITKLKEKARGVERFWHILDDERHTEVKHE